MRTVGVRIVTLEARRRDQSSGFARLAQRGVDMTVFQRLLVVLDQGKLDAAIDNGWFSPVPGEGVWPPIRCQSDVFTPGHALLLEIMRCRHDQVRVAPSTPREVEPAPGVQWLGGLARTP